MSVGLGLGLFFCAFLHLHLVFACLGLAFCVFLSFSLDYFVLALFAFIVLVIVSSLVRQQICKNISKMTYFVSSGIRRRCR